MRTLFVVVLVSTAFFAFACGGGSGAGSDKAPMTPDSEHPLVDGDGDGGMPAAPESK